MYQIIFLILFISCQQSAVSVDQEIQTVFPKETLTGAEQFQLYTDMLKNKRVGLVVNHTSRVGDTHLVDTLLRMSIDVRTIFAPEHGFRGAADAGAHLNNETDVETGLPIISLYGKSKKPSSEQLENIDILVFDIQDVGCRFYTYLSTMHYVMEACAENDIQLIILDRPNPNGSYVDGPLLDLDFKSFVGMHRIPVVHGMTLGELAQMINGEQWLTAGRPCNLSVISVKNWNRSDEYIIPIAPSPNLKSQSAIYHYPSLCFFEGTILSVGRGTDDPFTMVGHPDLPEGNYAFTPIPSPGAKNPKLNGQKCHGIQLHTPEFKDIKKTGIDLDFMVYAHKLLGRSDFFLANNFIDKLAGTDRLRLAIQQGLSADEIKAEWQADLDVFKKNRKPYLIYND